MTSSTFVRILTVFKLVKDVVRDHIGYGSAGLMLILADLPLEVEGYHQAGSNRIITGRRLLGAVLHNAPSRSVVNAYIFHLLLHEYIHSPSLLNEGDTRGLALQIFRDVFGPDHHASQVDVRGSRDMLRENRQLKEQPHDLQEPREFEIVPKFDSDGASYIR